MKSLMFLWREMLADAGIKCGIDTTMDGKTAHRRFEHEGTGFLTCTLPDFGKDLRKGLDQGRVTPDLFRGFARQAELPKFLGGFMERVFDRVSGVLLDDPDVEALHCVNQLAGAVGKLFVVPGEDRVRQSLFEYIECEKELKIHDRIYASEDNHCRESCRSICRHPAPRPPGRTAGVCIARSVRDNDGGSRRDPSVVPRCRCHSSCTALLSCPSGHKVLDPSQSLRDLREDFQKAARILFAGRLDGLETVFRGSPHDLPELLRPKHGPGATADRLLGNQKWLQSTWPQRLEEEFPYTVWALPRLSLYDEADRVSFLEPGAEIPVRVIPVPKTSRTARIIAAEPVAMQYMQQALASWLVPALESSWIGGCIGFTDQEPNRQMACEGSLTGDLATLDLSEASDRVSNQHVLDLLSRWPSVSKAVQAVRSRKADVPGFGVIRLSKYASMGSAMTFPLEAMVFLSLCLVGIAKSLNTPVSRSLVFNELLGKVRVFGDDIIVPAHHASAVADVLGAFGYRVNRNKSFWTGLYRESCGREYFAGHDVSIVKVRQSIVSDRRDVTALVATVSLRNQLYQAGYWGSARYLDNRLERVLNGHYPVVEETSVILGRVSVFSPQAESIDRDLHTPLVKGWKVVNTLPVNQLEGYPALMKWFISRGDEPLEDGHLVRSGRPKSTRVKLGDYRPY